MTSEEPYGIAMVRVLADLDRFSRDLSKKMRKTLDEAGKNADFDEFEKTAAKAGDDAGDKLGKGTERGVAKRRPEIRREGERHGKAFGSGFLAGLKPVLAKVALFGGLGVAGSAVGGFIAQALPGLLSTLPALGVAAAGGIGALVFALHGFASAVGAGISGDTDAFLEALGKLAPAARSVAKEIVGLTGVFKQLQQLVQQAFFAPLQGNFQQLARSLIPILRQQLPLLAGDFGKLFSGILSGLGSARGSGAISEILTNLDIGLTAFVPLMKQATEVFLAFGAKAAPFVLTAFQALAEGLSRLVGNLDAALGNGGAEKFFRNMVDVMVAVGTSLGPVLGLVGDIAGTFSSIGSPLLNLIGQLASVLRTALAPVLPPLAAVLGKLADGFGKLLLAATPGLTAIFAALGTALGMMGDQIPTLVDALAPLIVSLSQLLVGIGPQLGVLLGTILVNAITFVVQALTDMMPWWREFTPILTDLIKQLLPKANEYFQQLFLVFMNILPILPALVNLWIAWLPVIRELVPLLPAIIAFAIAFLGLLNAILPPLVMLITRFLEWYTALSKFGVEHSFAAFAHDLVAMITDIADTAQHAIDLLDKLLGKATNKSLRTFGDRNYNPTGGPARNLKAYAAGGLVTSPTLALVGEGGEREAVVPMGSPAKARRVAANTGLLRMLGTGGGGGDTNVRVFLGTREITDIVSVEVDRKFDRAANDLDNGTRG